MSDDEDYEIYQGLKILIVDDIPPNRILIKEYLEILGIKGDCVNDGAEAVEKVKENKYDLILMDIQMPIMDGVEATQIIRSRIDADVPIVALSGSATEDQLKASLTQGMNGYCIKPISFDKIKETVAQYAIKK